MLRPVVALATTAVLALAAAPAQARTVEVPEAVKPGVAFPVVLGGFDEAGELRSATLYVRGRGCPSAGCKVIAKATGTVGADGSGGGHITIPRKYRLANGKKRAFRGGQDVSVMPMVHSGNTTRWCFAMTRIN